MGAAQAPVASQTLASKMRPKSKDTVRKRLKYGPFKLRGANVCVLDFTSFNLYLRLTFHRKVFRLVVRRG